MVRKSKRKGSTVLGTILTILFVLGLVTAFILWPNAMMIVFHIGLFALIGTVLIVFLMMFLGIGPAAHRGIPQTSEESPAQPSKLAGKEAEKSSP